MDLSEQALANAYENNWTWDQTGWVADPQDSELQDFNNRWWGHPGPINNPLNIEALSMYFPRPSSILVRDCYLEMFNFIWADALFWKGRGGTLITGQPGTGASSSLLLFRRISS